MKNYVYLIVMLLLGVLLPQYQYAQPNWLWAKQGGGVGPSVIPGNADCATDADGFVYTVSAKMEKYDAAGNLIWSVSDMNGRAISVLPSGKICVTGTRMAFCPGPASSYVARYSDDGNLDWSRCIIPIGGGAVVRTRGISHDKLGNIWVIGEFSGTITAQPGNQTLSTPNGLNIFIAKYDNTGSLLLFKQYGSDASLLERAGDIDCASDGSVYITGSFTGTIDFDGQVLTSSGGSDIFLARLKESGGALWAKHGGSDALHFKDGGSGLAVDSQNNVYVVGCYAGSAVIHGTAFATNGNNDIGCFLFKVSPSGDPIWGRAFNGEREDTVRSVCIDAQDNPYITGSFVGKLNFGAIELESGEDKDINVFVTKYNSNGLLMWARRTAGQIKDSDPDAPFDANFGDGIAVAANSDVFVSGGYKKKLNFNNIELPGDENVNRSFIAKMGDAPQAPTIHSNSPICEGGTLFLTVSNVPEGAKYNWSGPNNFSSTLPAPIINTFSGIHVGTYTLVITLNGVASAPVTTAVTMESINPQITVIDNGCTSYILKASPAGASAYQWLKDGAPINGATDSVFVATVSGTYTVRVTSAAGCVGGSAPQQITVTPLPTLTAVTSNSPVCTGSALHLTATGPTDGFYHWQGPNNFISFDAQAVIPDASPANSGVYSVTVTVQGCTSLPQTVSVVVGSPPNIPNPTANSPICEGKTLTLSAALVPGASYNWTGPGNIASTLPSFTLPGVSFDFSGTWTLVVTTAGCPPVTLFKDVLVIGPNSPAPVAVLTNSPLCLDETLKLSVTPTFAGATYQWAGPNNFGSALAAPIIPDVSSIHAGTYSVKLTIAGCTTSAATGEVEIIPQPTAPIVANDTICTGTNTVLQVSNLNPEYIYHWYNDAFTTTALATGSTFNTDVLTQNRTYYVSAVRGSCQSARVAVKVFVTQAPELSLTKTDATAPGNGSIEATATNGTAPYTFSLNGGAFQPSGTFNNLNAGLHSIMVKDASGCIDRDTIRLFINCTFSLTAEISQFECSGTVTLTASAGTAPYTYSKDGINFQNGKIIEGLSSGNYLFIAKDQNGCTASVSLTISADNLSASRVAANWYFGKNAGLKFNPLPAAPLTNGALNTLEGCSSISDASGNLLFYTDGVTVFNKSHEAMPNGTGLQGDPSAAQAAVIVPKPGSITEYYIFTVPFRGQTDVGLRYSVVDMNLDAGKGDVTTKNILLHQPITERLTAVPHENGIDYWVLAHEWNSNAFYAYKVTALGVNLSPVISNAGSPIGGNTTEDAIGYLKFSLNGKWLACTQFGSGIVEIFSFDAATGKVAHPPLSLSPIPDVYGVEFSPDHTKFYISTLKNQAAQSIIYQFDLISGDIPASKISIHATNNLVGALQIGPDGKIYVAEQNANHLGVINSPNLAGAACNFVANGQTLSGKQSELGLPNILQSLLLPVKAKIQPLGTNHVCGGNITLLATPPGATKYEWFRNGTLISGASQSSYVATESGAYSVKVTVNSGCTSTSTAYNVKIISPLTLNTIKTNVTTVNGTNGTITATGNGGTPPYRYALDGGAYQASGYFTGLAAGEYQVNIIDANGCTQSHFITINGPQNCNFTVTTTVTSPNCYGESTASIKVNVSSTNPGANFGYEWSNGATASSLSNLAAGTYQVQVTDFTNNCKVLHTVVVTQPDELRIYATPTDATSITATNGNISCLLRGGTLPLFMTLDTLGIPTTSAFGNNRAFSGLTAGYYVARAKDSKGCTDSVTVFVGPNNRPRASEWITDGTIYSSDRSGNTVYIGGEFNWVGPYTGAVAVSDTITATAQNLPATNGKVYTVISDGAGGWFIGGEFTKVGTVTRNRLAHIKPDGTVNLNLNPNPNATVHALLLNSGVLYVGGAFTRIGGQTRNCIAAVNVSSGVVQSSWNPNANEVVYALSASSGVLYMGGRFTQVGNQNRNRLAAVNINNGTLTGWNPNADDEVHSIVATALTVYVSGKFTRLRNIVRPYIGAVSPGAGAVLNFAPIADGPVHALAIFGNEVYAGGAFSTINNESKPYLVAMNGTTGVVTTTFSPQPNNVVYGLFRDGGILYVAGEFTELGTKPRNYVGAVSVDNGLATNWNPQAGAVALSVAAFQGKAAAAGAFNSINVKLRKNLAAINETTGKATDWAPSANDVVRSVLVSENATVYVGGAFTQINGLNRRHLAEIDSISASTTAFNPAPNDDVYTLLKYQDKLVVGGKFTKVGIVTRNYTAMLNLDGSLVSSWHPFALAPVYALASWRNRILIGGEFSGIGGAFHKHLAAVNDFDGQAVDWKPQPDGPVYALMLSGSYVYFGGNFQNVKGQARAYTAAVHAETEVLQNFNPNPNNTVRAMSLRGRDVYIGGDFTKIGARKRYAAALVNDTSGVAKNWSPFMDNTVYHTAVHDTSIYFGGSYSQIGVENRSGFAEYVENVNCFIAANFFKNDTTAMLAIEPLRGTAPWQYKLSGAAFGSDSLFTNLDPGTYTLTVRDANKCLATQTLRIRLLQCDTPVGLEAVAITDESAVLRWERVRGANTYRVQIRIAGTNTWTNINTTDTTLLLSNLLADTEYEYRVRVNCVDNLQSGFTEIGGFITLQLFDCAPPFDVEITEDTTKAIAQWSPVNGALAYGIRYRKVGSPLFIETQLTTTNFTMTNLDPDSDYEFFIWSICSNGTISDKLESGFTTKAANCGRVATINILSTSSTQATFSWNVVQNAQLYIVEYRKQGADNFTITSTADVPLLLTGLSANTTYEIRIKVRCIDGSEGIYSPLQTFSTGASTCPKPTGFSFSNITDMSGTISWQVVSGAVQYEVSFRPLGEAAFGVFFVTQPTIILTPLEPGTTYEVRVRTLCADESFSEYSTTQQFTSLSFCTTPQGLNIVSSTTTAQVQWSFVAGISTYTLAFRIKNSGAPWTNVNVGNALNFTLTNLAPGQVYELRLRGRCSNGALSGWTPIVEFATLSAKEMTTQTLTAGFAANVYPNPSNGVFYLEWFSNEPVTLEVWDAQGKSVYLQTLGKEFQSYEINGNEWASGIYTLRLRTDKNEKAIRLIKR